MTCAYGSFMEALLRAVRAEGAIKLCEVERKKGNAFEGDGCHGRDAKNLCKMAELMLEMDLSFSLRCLLQLCSLELDSRKLLGSMEDATNFGCCVRPVASTYSLMIHGFFWKGHIVFLNR